MNSLMLDSNFQTIEKFLNEAQKIIVSKRVNKVNLEYIDIIQECNDITIEIYFKRNNTNLKILIEKWIFHLIVDKTKKQRNSTYKKISSFIRTIHSYCRILPAFYFYSNKFDYSLEYKLHFNDKLSIDTKFMKESIKLIHHNELSIAKVKLKIEYILKNDIFVIEEELKKNIIINIPRKRFYSDDARKASQESSKETNYSDKLVYDEIKENLSVSSQNSFHKYDNLENEKKQIHLLFNKKLSNVEINTSYEYISLQYDDSENYMNISNDSFILELDDNTSNDPERNRIDIFIKLNGLKEVLLRSSPIKFNLSEIYKTCTKI